jgi:hypothetical protein
MRKHFVVAVLALAMAVPAVSHATDMTGKWGVGYFRPQAPVGIRWWASPKIGIDLGVGFDSFSPDKGSSTTAFNIDAGVPIVLHSMDTVHFFFRPGFTWSTDGQDESKGPKVTTFGVSGSLGAEYFFTPSFSIEAAHGIVYTSVNTKDNLATPHVDTTDSHFMSEAFGISDVGFHYYFGGK